MVHLPLTKTKTKGWHEIDSKKKLQSIFPVGSIEPSPAHRRPPPDDLTPAAQPEEKTIVCGARHLKKPSASSANVADLSPRNCVSHPFAVQPRTCWPLQELYWAFIRYSMSQSDINLARTKKKKYGVDGDGCQCCFMSTSM